MPISYEYPIAPLPTDELPEKPTLAHSAYLSAQKPFYEVGFVGSYLLPGQASYNTRQRLSDKIDLINRTLSDPRQSTTQQAFNMVSGFAGSIAADAPLFSVGGAAGGLAAAGLKQAAKIALPEAYMAVAKKPLNKLVTGALGSYFPRKTGIEAGTDLIKFYTGYKGAVLPEHVLENYHKENDSLDVDNLIHDWSSDNYGFLLPAVGLTAGYLGYKIFKVGKDAKRAAIEAERLVKSHKTAKTARESDLKLAVSRAEQMGKDIDAQVKRRTELEDMLIGAHALGDLTEAEHHWYLDYLDHPEDQAKLLESSKEILAQAQVPYDRVTGRVWIPLLSRGQLGNFKKALTDEVSANLEGADRNYLSDYVMKNMLDESRDFMQSNPKFLTAMKGYVHFVQNKLLKRDKSLKALDNILEDHLHVGLKKREMFSQQNIYKHLKKLNLKDLSQVPYIVPEGVEHKLKLARKLDRILSQKGKRYAEWYKEGLHEKIKEQLKSTRLLTPQEELVNLKAKLFDNGKLKKNYKTSKPYHRLEELSQVWANAKTLLDRIKLEEAYDKAGAFNKILDHFVNLVDSNASRLADPNNVIQYIKSRIESTVPTLKSAEFDKPTTTIPKEEKTEVKAAKETKDKLSEAKQTIADYGTEDLQNEFKIEENRVSQFEENQSALDELIKCALGEMYG